MGNPKTWRDFVTGYKLTVTYIAVIVTLLLIFQVIELAVLHE